MKKLIILFCLLFVLPIFGCNKPSSDILDTLPPVSSAPVPDEDFSSSEEDEEESNENEENTESTVQLKKKYYIVSSTNSLRVRSAPSSSSSVLGYLDKNDALSLVEQSGNYYKTVFREKTAYVHTSYASIMEIETSDEKSEKAIDVGSTLMGYPYVWGSQRYHWGNGKLNSNFVDGEFDCSALTLYVYYHSSGIILDVTSRTQVNNGVEVKRQDLKRGDLMFFTNESRKNKVGAERIGHVGIYFGNNYILHTASDHAVIEPISNTRWSYYITARRVVQN